jgi:glutamate racemase
VVLGCTHFPVLGGLIAAAAGSGVQIVDSAATTAATVREELARRSLLQAGNATGAKLKLLATDGVERFASVGGRFLGTTLRAADVELVDF